MQKQKKFIPHYRREKNHQQPQRHDFNYLETAKQVFYVAWFSSLSIGGSILFLYLISESIFPRGMSIEDFLLISFVAFSFSIITLVGIISGATISYWISFLIILFSERRNKKKGIFTQTSTPTILRNKFLAIISTLSAASIIFLISNTEISEKNIKFIITIGYFFLIGFFLLVFLVKKTELPSKLQKILFFLLVIFSATITIKPMLLDLTMMVAGIRSWPDRLITMTREDASKVLAIAKLHNLAIEFCEIPEKNKKGTKNVQIIWPGIGENSYVRLSEGGDLNKKSLLIPLSKDVEAYPSINTPADCSKSLF